MRSTHCSTAVVVAAVALAALTTRCDDGDDDGGWVRLCTLTGNGSSRLNVSMPCGVRVQSGGTVDGGERLPIADGRPQTDVDEATVVGHDDFDGIVVDDNGDEDGVGDAADDGMVLQQDAEQEKRRGGAVAELMVAYLLDARNRLYDRILYLLDLLQNAFFRTKFNRRSRRDSIQRQVNDGVSSTGRRANKNRNPSITSVIMRPTFERSMMTMSFLMFGVFVIRVVQKLVQTLQQPGDTTPFSPATLSGIF